MAPRETPKPLHAPRAAVKLGADLSPAVAAIEKAYRQIQRRHRDVPNATIVVKRDQKAWGHTTVHAAWAPAGQAAPDRLEIMISGENLARGARYVAATLIHEAAHARNLARGIVDTDVNGRHNRKFAQSAEEMGLTVAERGWLGWTDTTLNEESATKWRAMIATIEAGLTKSAAAPRLAARVAVGGTGKGKGTTPPAAPGIGIVAPPKRGNRNLIKATCGCGYSIRASRGVLDKATPECGACGGKFEE